MRKQPNVKASTPASGSTPTIPPCATTKEIAAAGVGRVLASDPRIDKLVDAFLAWPLPESVCSDRCALIRGYPHRSGTNLLTAIEARQMFEYVMAKVSNDKLSHTAPTTT